MSGPSHILDSPLGPVRIVARDGAIIGLTWVAEDAAAPVAAPSDLLNEAARQLSDYFAGRLKRFDLPLAPGGSPLQRAVWDAMLAIPFGRYRTYGEVAAEVGAPARAVGGACGANPIPVIIPCHRILAAGGKLGGFSARGGVETKVWLLRHEGALL